MVRYTKRQSKKYRQQYYCANKNKALEQKRENYECNADIRKDADKQMYRTNAEKKKYALNTTVHYKLPHGPAGNMGYYS